MTCFGSLAQGDLSSTIIPWGFVSQQKVSESVKPDRAGDVPGDDGRVEKRAEHLKLDTWEFLRVRHFLSINAGCPLHPSSFCVKKTEKQDLPAISYRFTAVFLFFSRPCVLGSGARLPMRR